MIAVKCNVPARYTRLFLNPSVDRICAILALAPFAFTLVRIIFLNPVQIDLLRLIYFVEMFVLFSTMLLRRPPVRITNKPIYWMLALLASYWQSLGIFFTNDGAHLIPSWVAILIALVDTSWYVWSLLSLGRNLGFVPAERSVVVRGTYRFVRHPIYCALFFGMLGSLLQHFSLQNFIFISLGILWYVIKSFLEEDFLKHNPAYALYMKRVTFRWIPYIL